MKGTPRLPLANDGVRSPSTKYAFKAAASTVRQHPAISVPADLSVVVVTIGINRNTTKITVVRIVQTAAATPLFPLTWHSVAGSQSRTSTLSLILEGSSGDLDEVLGVP